MRVLAETSDSILLEVSLEDAPGMSVEDQITSLEFYLSVPTSALLAGTARGLVFRPDTFFMQLAHAPACLRRRTVAATGASDMAAPAGKSDFPVGLGTFLAVAGAAVLGAGALADSSYTKRQHLLSPAKTQPVHASPAF